MKAQTLIVVFGLAETENWMEQMWGTPNQKILGRLSLALKLFQGRYTGDDPRVYVGTAAGIVGGADKLPLERNPEAVMREQLVQEQQFWAPGTVALLNRVVWDHKSSTTQEEVETILQLVKAEGYRRVVLVTAPSHAPRVFQTFWKGLGEFEGLDAHDIEVVVAPSDVDYASAKESSTVIVEPPHRADDPRGQVFAELWLSNLCGRCFRVLAKDYENFAQELHRLLERFKA
jgi:hypothetical protein